MLRGRYRIICCDARGRERWREEFENLIVNVGKNLILDQSLAGSGYTAVEYLGLVSSVGYSAIAATDTMASHPGWTEAGGTNAPTFAARGACAWAAAANGSKALSTNPAFTMTGGGTIKGAFLVGGPGAVNTVGSTAGTLISAGLFAGGDRAVNTNDVVNVSYSVSI